ncbi:FAD-dependent monooxygenase [Runella aurantiaca]|nr:FAD-dependent monooxygenase [Runella aurantiaca]
MKIAIIGGGIAGLTTAIALRQIGINVSIYEANQELRPAGAGIALAANAVKAFELLGLRDKILAHGNPFELFSILNKQGKIITESNHFAAVEKYKVIGSFSIHRSDLQKTLLEAIEDIPLYLGHQFLTLTQNNEGVTLVFRNGHTATFDYVLAADGIHSAVRQQLVPDTKIRYAGYTCWRGVTDTAPSGLNPKQATETWASEGRFGIVPLQGGRIYWFACVNAPTGDEPRFRNFSKTDLLRHFGQLHAPVAQIIGLTPEKRILHNDIIDLKPLRQLAYGKVLLIGDAAHAMTPNMGQGACQGIEDAVVLQRLIRQYPTDLSEVFQKFEAVRLPRTTTIVNRSFTLGKIAQASQPGLIALRNALFRLMPASMNNRQLDFIMDMNAA